MNQKYRLAKLNARIIEMSYELEDMHDKFEYRNSLQLGDAIDAKEDKTYWIIRFSGIRYSFL